MNIKIIPFESFSLDLPKACSSALNCVDQHTHESQFGRSFNPQNKRFAGDVTEHGFKIRRSVEYQNSFSPIITGTISPNNDQCSMMVTMRMHYFVMAFMFIWLSGALLMTLGGLSLAISGTNAFISFLIGYGLMMRSFWKEARLAKDELNFIFK